MHKQWTEASVTGKRGKEYCIGKQQAKQSVDQRAEKSQALFCCQPFGAHLRKALRPIKQAAHKCGSD